MRPGERIKILRILFGLTQEQLATSAAVNRASIVSWERGSYNPSHSAATALGSVLLCSPGYLLFGDKLIYSACWQPTSPQRSKYLKDYIDDVNTLLPQFLFENSINCMAFYDANNGRLAFLGRAGSPLSCILFLKPEVIDCFETAFSNIERIEIEGFTGYPQATLGFQEKDDSDSLKIFFRLASVSGIKLNEDAIASALLKVQKTRGLQSDAVHTSYAKTAFSYFFYVSSKYEGTDDWSMQLSCLFSDIFERVYEEVERKSLTWSLANLDKEILEMIRKFFEGQGLKRKPGVEWPAQPQNSAEEWF
jgi:DNA-binding XRE family transcriptional regulator